MNIIEEYTTAKKTPCADDSEFCITDGTIQDIKQKYNLDGSPQQIINDGIKLTQCKSSKCLLQKTNTSNARADIPKLKPEFNFHGPLTNFEIDDTLNIYARHYNFFNCPFCMIDIFSYNNTLRTINLDDVQNGRTMQIIDREKIFRKNTSFGVVLNTDVHTGRGKHWICIFADLQNKTVEFFNSTGNPPHENVVKLMNIFCEQINGTPIIVNKYPHQYGNLECGVYVLFYIRSRLDGTPYKQFSAKRVKDSDMSEYRKYIFSNIF